MAAPSKSRGAGLYSRARKYYVCPYFKTTAGVSLSGEPVEILDDSSSDQMLGEAVLISLRRNRVNVPHPHPADFGKMRQPVLEAAGVKNWTAFSKGARFCSISEDDACVTVTPSRKAPRAAFLFLPEDEVKLAPSPTAEALGAAVREALRRCA